MSPSHNYNEEAAKSFSRFSQEKTDRFRQEFNDDLLDTTENTISSVHSSDKSCSLVFMLSPKTKS